MEQYNSVQQLLKKKEGHKDRKPVFPSTVIQAVFDGKTGASLEAILAQFNSIYIQYQGSPEATRNIIPVEMRRAGLTITYMNMDSETITERATSAVQKDNDHWSLNINWTRVDELSLSGDIAVSANGTWIINGQDTGVKAVGPKGDAGITPWLKTIDNKLHFSYDNVNWEPCSENIAAWFRFKATSSTGLEPSVGKFQISRDNKNWEDLSPEITNALRIAGYVATSSALPSGKPVGTIYGVGPTFAAEDTAHTNPIYRLYVYDGSKWVDNGTFTSIAAGVVQETGNSETLVMSQKATTEKLSELGSAVRGKNIFIGSLKGNNSINEQGEIVKSAYDLAVSDMIILENEISHITISQTGGRLDPFTYCRFLYDDLTIANVVKLDASFYQTLEVPSGAKYFQYTIGNFSKSSEFQVESGTIATNYEKPKFLSSYSLQKKIDAFYHDTDDYALVVLDADDKILSGVTKDNVSFDYCDKNKNTISRVDNLRSIKSSNIITKPVGIASHHQDRDTDYNIKSVKNIIALNIGVERGVEINFYDENNKQYIPDNIIEYLWSCSKNNVPYDQLFLLQSPSRWYYYSKGEEWCLGIARMRAAMMSALLNGKVKLYTETTGSFSYKAKYVETQNEPNAYKLYNYTGSDEIQKRVELTAKEQREIYNTIKKSHCDNDILLGIDTTVFDAGYKRIYIVNGVEYDYIPNGCKSVLVNYYKDSEIIKSESFSANAEIICVIDTFEVNGEWVVCNNYEGLPHRAVAVVSNGSDTPLTVLNGGYSFLLTDNFARDMLTYTFEDGSDTCDYIDIFNFHSYGKLSDSGNIILSDFARLIPKLSNKECWVTETGFSATQQSEEFIAGATITNIITLLASGVSKVFIYQLSRHERGMSTTREGYFGVYHSSFETPYLSFKCVTDDKENNLFYGSDYFALIKKDTNYLVLDTGLSKVKVDGLRIYGFNKNFVLREVKVNGSVVISNVQMYANGTKYVDIPASAFENCNSSSKIEFDVDESVMSLSVLRDWIPTKTAESLKFISSLLEGGNRPTLRTIGNIRISTFQSSFGKCFVLWGNTSKRIVPVGDCIIYDYLGRVVNDIKISHALPIIICGCDAIKLL